MPRPKYTDFYRRPEIFLAELMQKYARGEFLEKGAAPSVLLRALVVAVDVVGGKLESPDPGSNDKVDHKLPNGQTVSLPAQVGPANPKNSIKARILTDAQDQFYSDTTLRVFWPFFPEHVSVPIKPGEHVYVIFEDAGMTHGLWVGKIPGHEGLNFKPGHETYQALDEARLSSKFDDTANASSQQAKYDTELEASQSGISNGRLADKFDDTKTGGGS
jgi:hypothetical protein